MALQMQVSRTPSSAVGSVPCASQWPVKNFTFGFIGVEKRKEKVAGFLELKKKKKGLSFVVKSSLETVVPVVGVVTEVNKDNFWPIVKGAGEKAVVLDMYTQWCGPCKVMAPKFQELSEKYLDVIFLKLDCNQENKPLAKELGIKVVPTFKIFKDGNIVKEISGAKYDDLVLAIETVRSN